MKQLKYELFQELCDFWKNLIFYYFLLAWNVLLFKSTQTEIDRKIFEKAKYKILPDNFDSEKLINDKDKIKR